MYKLYKVVITACLLFIFNPCLAQENKLAAVEENIEQRIETGSFVGIFVGQVSPDGTVYTLEKGTLQVNGNQQVTDKSIFEIGSISKVFTTLLLAQVMEEQDISLDDEAGKYLPESMELPAFKGQKILIRHLVTHTSGLPSLPDNLFPEDSSNPYADYTLEELVTYLKDKELVRSPGSNFEYSNMGMALLGHILEEQTGKEYEQLVIERIARPLNMSSTKIKITDADSTRLARGHAKGNTVANWDLPVFEGAGALRSTGSDIMIFLKSQIGLSKTDLYPLMKKTQQPLYDIDQGLSQEMDKVGMGWFYATDKDTIIWHSGGTGGYRTFIGINKETGSGAVILSNSTTDISDIYFHLLDSSYELRDLESSISLTQQELDRFVGEYKSQRGFSFFVTHDNEGLFIRVSGQNKAPVQPIANNKFVNKQVGAEFTFDTTEFGDISKITLQQGGQEIPAEKVSDEVTEPEEREAISVSEQILKRYVGTYQLTPAFSIKVTLESGQLYAQATGQPKLPIFPETKTKFFYKAVDAQLEFIKNGEGSFHKMYLYQTGRVLEGNKQ